MTITRKGQGVIESLLLTPFMLAAFTTLLYLFYWTSLEFFSNYQLEEALLCSARKQLQNSCQNELRNSLKKVVLFKEHISAQIESNSANLSGHVHIELKVFSINLDKTLKLPLEKNL